MASGHRLQLQETFILILYTIMFLSIKGRNDIFYFRTHFMPALEIFSQKSNTIYLILLSIRHLGTQTSTITTKSAAKNFCNTLNLHPFQRSVCNNFTDLIPSVADGIRISIEECQEQFQTRQWNCSIMAGAGNSIFGPMIRKGMCIICL